MIISICLVLSVFNGARSASSLVEPDVRQFFASNPNVGVVDTLDSTIPEEQFSILFVDSNLYDSDSYALLRNNFENLIDKGITLVFYGKYCEDMLKQFKLRAFVTNPYSDGIMTGVRYYSYFGVQSEFYTSGMRIRGSGLSIANLQIAYDWASTPSEKGVGVGSPNMLLDGPSWLPIGDWSDPDGIWEPYGKLNMRVDVDKLYNDENNIYDWYSSKIQQQVVPGHIAWDNDWKWDWIDHYSYDKVGAGGCTGQAVDYAPTTTFGSETVSVSISASASGGPSAEDAWSYSRTEMQITDSSDYSVGRIQWRHDIDVGNNPAFSTFNAHPGHTMRVSQGEECIYWNSNYARFARPIVAPWWWETWDSPPSLLGYVHAGP